MGQFNLELGPRELVNSKRTKQINVSHGEFRRIEDKFIVNKSHRKFLINLLETYLRPSYPMPGTLYTKIESLYFDSTELDLFKHHFMSLEKRYKLRIRRYAPNGVWDDGPALLEIKKKIKKGEGESSISKKIRIHITTDALNDLKEGKKITLSEELYQLNSKLDLHIFEKRVRQANYLIELFNLKPRISVSYNRFAFELNNLRATLDSDLEIAVHNEITSHNCQDLKASDVWTLASFEMKKFSQLKHMVFEIKHTGTIPSWAEQALIQLQIQKNHFSKYCWSISRLINANENARKNEAMTC